MPLWLRPAERHCCGERSIRALMDLPIKTCRCSTRFTSRGRNTPLCCPFRASLMTGQYAHNSEVRRNGDTRNLNHEHTLQRYLYDGGYRTALLGKFLNSWPREDPPPYFERFVLGTGYYKQKPINVDGKMKVITQYLPYFLRKRACLLYTSPS